MFLLKYANSLITRHAFRAVKSLVCSVGSTLAHEHIVLPKSCHFLLKLVAVNPLWRFPSHFTSFYLCLVCSEGSFSLIWLCFQSFNPRIRLEKIVTRSLDGGTGVSIGPPPPHTYNKLHWYFQLSETTWCLIGFHGNNSQILK